MESSLRRPANLAFLVGVAVLMTGWWVELRPTTWLGGPASFVVVRGTSMLPRLRTGDFVVAEAQPSYRVGDVVVYRVPVGEPGAGDELIHRIVAGDAAAGYVMKGDNNPSPDPWTVPRGDVLGREALVIPGIGSWFLVVRSPLFAGAIAAILAITLVLRPPAWMRRLESLGGRGKARDRGSVASDCTGAPVAQRLESSHGPGHPRTGARPGSEPARRGPGPLLRPGP
jgi:signal peptidase I